MARIICSLTRSRHIPIPREAEQTREHQNDLAFSGEEPNRDEILAAFGVGLEMLGKTESQTRANADTLVFVFMKFGVPRILSLDNRYQGDSSSRFDPEIRVFPEGNPKIEER